jgi:hypothetical protein
VTWRSRLAELTIANDRGAPPEEGRKPPEDSAKQAVHQRVVCTQNAWKEIVSFKTTRARSEATAARPFAVALRLTHTPPKCQRGIQR